jgi:predicted dienelactone hydrolase
MSPDLYAPLLEHLVSHGYVVAAPWHPGSNTLDSFPRPDPLAAAGSALERPVEVSFALDELLRMNQDPHSPLFGLVDGTRAGICGQSFGGYTTLLVAGAEVDANFEFTMAGGALGEAGGDTVSTADYCESIGWEEGSPTCALLRDALAGSGRMSLLDDRFRAAVAITPPLYAAFGEEGIAEVSRPVLITAGGLDEQVDYESNILLNRAGFFRRLGYLSPTTMAWASENLAFPMDSWTLQALHAGSQFGSVRHLCYTEE